MRLREHLLVREIWDKAIFFLSRLIASRKEKGCLHTLLPWWNLTKWKLTGFFGTQILLALELGPHLRKKFPLAIVIWEPKLETSAFLSNIFVTFETHADKEEKAHLLKLIWASAVGWYCITVGFCQNHCYNQPTFPLHFNNLSFKRSLLVQP